MRCQWVVLLATCAMVLTAPSAHAFNETSWRGMEEGLVRLAVLVLMAAAAVGALVVLIIWAICSAIGRARRSAAEAQREEQMAARPEEGSGTAAPPLPPLPDEPRAAAPPPTAVPRWPGIVSVCLGIVSVVGRQGVPLLSSLALRMGLLGLDIHCVGNVIGLGLGIVAIWLGQRSLGWVGLILNAVQLLRPILGYGGAHPSWFA